jgi:4-hydroxybenzoate polyprenyltransferase
VIPICVDLDGTLLRTDLLFESFARLARQKPWLLPLVPFWLLSGRAALKWRIAEQVSLDVSILPYNSALLEWLHKQKSLGRRLILVTAADEILARQVASHLGIFDEVLASDGRQNLKGGTKTEAIRRLISGPFDYAGNAHSDVPVWRECNIAIVVGTGSMVKRLRQPADRVIVFERPGRHWRDYAAALRVHQWAKNVLGYAPLITSHELFHFGLVWRCTVAMGLFSLCSSAQYMINDLVDLDSDRRHATKRLRPFACGNLPLQAGLALAPALLIAAFAGAWALDRNFALTVAGYTVAALAYSLYFKKAVLLDVFVLSGLLLLRVIAGQLVTGVVYSVWLLSFGFFLLLSLGFSKRCTELSTARSDSESLAGRGYQVADLSQVNAFGVCSAFLAAVVFMLYLQSDRVRELYRSPELLWLLSPLFLYWITRVWILSSRGLVHEDPVMFVLKDRPTWWVACLSALIMALAGAKSWSGHTP